MSERPLVSILINNYNYGKFLPEAIDSALAQTYDRCETIVVDDGSTDNSQEIIASYGDRIVPIFKTNGGQASAFNAGFAASSGDIICFLDADDVFLPEKAAAIASVAIDNRDTHWFYHPLEYQNETKE
ncbi:MAG: glycosyltransferase family 2 protein, partial [Xenococcaceae cyanobacterium]